VGGKHEWRTTSDEAFLYRGWDHALPCWLDQWHDRELILGLSCGMDGLIGGVDEEAQELLLNCSR